MTLALRFTSFGPERTLQSSPGTLFRATGFSFISATVDIVRKPGYNVHEQKNRKSLVVRT